MYVSTHCSGISVFVAMHKVKPVGKSLGKNHNNILTYFQEIIFINNLILTCLKLVSSPIERAINNKRVTIKIYSYANKHIRNQLCKNYFKCLKYLFSIIDITCKNIFTNLNMIQKLVCLFCIYTLPQSLFICISSSN